MTEELHECHFNNNFVWVCMYIVGCVCIVRGVCVLGGTEMS